MLMEVLKMTTICIDGGIVHTFMYPKKTLNFTKAQKLMPTNTDESRVSTRNFLIKEFSFLQESENLTVEREL